MDLIQSLKNIGLNEKQAQTYLSLLQLGKATAYQVSKHSQIKKSTTYVILDELIDKSAVTRIPREKVLQYVATPPENLFAQAQSKLQTAQESLGELNALRKGKKNEVSVTYYEGLAGIKDMYARGIKAYKKDAPISAFFAHSRDTDPALLAYWPEVNEAMRRAKIRIKGLSVDDPTIHEYIKQRDPKYNLINLKLLDRSKYDSNISIEIFDKFVQITSHRYAQGIVINNPDIADALRQIFNLVWERKDIVNLQIK